MNEKKGDIILFDLPTFPKGVIALSLISVAGCLSEQYNVRIIDLNFTDFTAFNPQYEKLRLMSPSGDHLMYGLKVSSQNFTQAISLTRQLRTLNPETKIVWGGELPSLLPDKCLEYADTVIGGLFEPVADSFMNDLSHGSLQKRYFGENTSIEYLIKPDFSLLPHPDRYYQFMGYPLETSRGCTEKCIFCMVHTMQKKHYNLNKMDVLQGIISQYKDRFINIVDYNFGVDTEHVIEVSKLIRNAGALGWMAEMCIELLDNDRLLSALRDSHCKMIYCGLESIDQKSLNSVHKMNTNHIANYARIIRKVQSYGIQIGAGIILGLDGTHENTFDELYRFYHDMGIIYAKLTFLTYNPGTKVHEYVKKRGVFVTEEIPAYDGNQLTYLPHGVDADYVAVGTAKFIRKYYSLTGIISRSFKTRLSVLGRIEYILFALSYRIVYQDWLRYDILTKPQNIRTLTDRAFTKSQSAGMIEKALFRIRKWRMKQ